MKNENIKMKNDNGKLKNMAKNNSLFIVLSITTLFALLMSLLSLTKLGNLGDSDPLLTPLRIINRNIAALSFVIFTLIVYLWRKE